MSAVRPRKRARVNADDPPKVKYERSPSPLVVARKLVTSGTKRCAPIPNNCLSSCPEYKRNRSEWVARCVKELEELSLIPDRKLIRDDGLIIDWRSDVPVWSDTLKPDQLDLAATIMHVHRSNERRHRPTEPLPVVLSTGSQSLPKKRLPVPPRPKHRINPQPTEPGSSSSCFERLPLPDEIERRMTSTAHRVSSSVADRMNTPAETSNPHFQVVLPPKPSNRIRDPPVIPCTSSVAKEVMSEMTLNYLRQYIQTYEADRASLASAYARNASFAYRVHRLDQNTSGAGPIWTASPQCFSSGNRRTRLNIATTLLMLPSLHTNARNQATARVEYDMFYLGAELGMFVVCRVVTSTKTVAHNFILQRKEVDEEDATIEGVWPLTATAHQILVFEC